MKDNLFLELHQDKSKILPINKGIEFLGMRIFPYHRLLKKKNLRKFQKKSILINKNFFENKIDYDKVYDFFEGWCAYAKNASTYKLRKNVLQNYGKRYRKEVSTKEVNRFQKILTKK